MSATKPPRSSRAKATKPRPSRAAKGVDPEMFRELAKRIPDLSTEEIAGLISDMTPLRREGTPAEEKAQGDRMQQTARAPRTDDELHAWILRETGFNIPRVSVCDDHCAPFDPIADAYFNRQSALLIMASRESGKCLTAGSLIYDIETGDRVRLDEVVNEGRLDRVLTMTKDGRVIDAPVSFRWRTGVKECRRVTTLSGRSVEVTPEHPFMTARGWVKCDDLADLEHIAVPAFLPPPKSPTRIPDAHLGLLAVLLAEGCYTNSSVTFSTEDSEIFSIVEERANEMNCDVRHIERCDYRINKRGKHNLFNPVRQMLNDYGIGHEKAIEKKFPDAIFRLDQDQLSRFLSIFWMCDGYLLERCAEITLGSQQMIEQIQHLLLRFGVQSRVAYKLSKYDGKEFDAWRLTVYGNCIERFSKAVPRMWGEKRRRLNALVAKKRCPSAGRPELTHELMELFREQFPQRARNTGQQRTREALEMLGWHPAPGQRPSMGASMLTRGKVINLQVRRLRALCHAHSVSEEKFALLLSDEIWWDPVISIDEIGEQEVFDLTMVPTESFIANDVIVHNTIGVAILHYVNAETKPGCEGLSFGAILPQAKRAYRYIRDFIFTRDEHGNRIIKPQIQGDPTREKTEWKSGSSVEIVVGTLSGVNSPHTQVVHADELDLMERDVFAESRNVSSSKQLPGGARIPACDIATSTRKSTRGLMQELLDEVEVAKKQGHVPPWHVYAYCFRESAAEVSSCRCVEPVTRVRRLIKRGLPPSSLCRCDTVVKGEWSEGVPRTLESVCRGDLFRSRGWMDITDIERKFQQNSQAVWEAQMECRRPMADGLYLPSFSRQRNCVRGWVPRPQYGRIFSGVDWGGAKSTANNVCLWIQGPIHHPVEIMGFGMVPVVVPQGSYVIFDEIFVADVGASKMADMVVAREIPYRNKFPGWKVRGRFADMAGAQQRNDWHEHNPPLRTQWYITRDFDPSVETIRTLVDDNLLYVDVTSCPEVADDFEAWRQKNGKEVSDSATHGPAAARMALANVVVLERRREREQGKAAAMPAVRERGLADPAVAALGASGTNGVGSQGVSSEKWRESFGMTSPRASRGGVDGWRIA
jgi:intein/homing endonuclease